MAEVPLDFPRAWVEFDNPVKAGERFRCDLTWLTSKWTCIYGNGCKGIYATAPDFGCCTLGAHFSGKADEKRVLKWADELTDDDWQFRKVGKKKGVVVKDDEGDRKTRVVDGACIFLNREGFEGGEGCALHHLAASRDISFVETKPDVCWQLPIRRTFETTEYPDDVTIDIVVISEYDRRGWGAGGADLDWYCSGNTEAHIAKDPVYVTNRDELIGLMGESAYDVLVEHCQAREAVLAKSKDKATRQGLAVHPADPA